MCYVKTGKNDKKQVKDLCNDTDNFWITIFKGKKQIQSSIHGMLLFI